jgi:hypothetical protein
MKSLKFFVNFVYPHSKDSIFKKSGIIGFVKNLGQNGNILKK